MNMVETLVGDGDELRLVVRRTARLGVPLGAARPQHILLAVAHTVDAVLQLLIAVDGHVPDEIVVIGDAAKAVLQAVLRFLGTADEPLQHLALQGLTFLDMSLQLLLPGCKDSACYSC